MSKLYGATQADAVSGPKLIYRSYWLLLDPMLRVFRALPITATAELLELIEILPPLKQTQSQTVPVES